MKPLPLSLAAWVSLALTGYLLTQKDHAIGHALLFVLPAVAMALTMLSRGSDVSSRIGRIAWWMVTITGWLAVAFLALGRIEGSRFAYIDNQQLLIAAGLTWVTAAWTMLKMRAFPTRRSVFEASVAALVVFSTAAGFVWQQEVRTRELEQKALARWAEIGLPMDTFEKSLKPMQANKSLGTLGQVLRDFVNAGVYRPRSPLNGVATPAVVVEAFQVNERKLPPTDLIPAANHPTPELDSHAAQLIASYKTILSEEAPVWAANPSDHRRMQTPNFVALRKLVQLINADANLRIERGDIEGARLAIKAAHRVTERLPENPSMMSLMMRVAIDSMLASTEVRLPAEAGSLEAIAADARQLTAALQRAVQLESLALARLVIIAEATPAHGWLSAVSLPSWANRILDAPLLRRDCQENSLINAEVVALLKDPVLLKLSDLGSKRFDRLFNGETSPFAVNAQQAFARIYASLVLREQTELLRMARDRMAIGQTLESRESVVLPGRHWHFTSDTAANTVSIRLDKIPTWIAKGDIAPASFWVLPLDGSKTWQFRAPVHAASR